MDKWKVIHLTKHAFLVTPEEIKHTVVWQVELNGRKNMDFCAKDQLGVMIEITPLLEHRKREGLNRNIYIWWTKRGIDRNLTVETLTKQTGRGNAIIFSEQGLDDYDFEYYSFQLHRLSPCSSSSSLPGSPQIFPLQTLRRSS